MESGITADMEQTATPYGRIGKTPLSRREQAVGAYNFLLGILVASVSSTPESVYALKTLWTFVEKELEVGPEA